MSSHSLNKKCNENLFVLNSSCLINGADQSDSNMIHFQTLNQSNKTTIVSNEHIDFLADKARFYWKHIAREMDLNECQIVEIDRNAELSNKLKAVINIWLNENRLNNSSKHNDENSRVEFHSILNILSACRLNKIKGLLLKLYSGELATLKLCTKRIDS